MLMSVAVDILKLENVFTHLRRELLQTLWKGLWVVQIRTYKVTVSRGVGRLSFQCRRKIVVNAALSHDRVKFNNLNFNDAPNGQNNKPAGLRVSCNRLQTLYRSRHFPYRTRIHTHRL